MVVLFCLILIDTSPSIFEDNNILQISPTFLTIRNCESLYELRYSLTVSKTIPKMEIRDIR